MFQMRNKNSYIQFNVKLIVLPKILHHLIWKIDSTIIKYTSQGSLTVKKRKVDKLSALLKSIDIYRQQASFAPFPFELF